MGSYSSSDDEFINEELHETPCTRKALPHKSLLCELHTITMRPAFFRSSFMRDQIWTLQRELMLQRMVFMLLQKHEVMSETLLNNIQTTVEAEAKPIEEAAEGFNAAKTFKEHFLYIGEWKAGVSKFLETIDQKIKPHLKKFCLGIVDRLLRGNSSMDYDIFAFIDIILLKLKDLENSKSKMIAPVKKQMENLSVMLNFACRFVGKETNLDEYLQNFMVYFGPWVDIAAALVILYWVDEKDKELFALVSPSLQKFNLSNILELVEAYIVVIKISKPSNVSEIFMMRKFVGIFTNIVLENLIVSTYDHFEMLKDKLALWIALLMDPLQTDSEDEKLICARTNLLVTKAESLICSLCLNKMGEDIAERRNILLNDFLEKMNKATAEVRQLQVELPDLSWNNFPQEYGRGFFDFLMGNLQKKLESAVDMFPFEKHLIAVVHKELLLLSSFLVDIFELQDKELRDTWIQASNIAYLVDNVTDSCLSSIDVPIWSNMMHLSNAIEKIQFVKTEVSKIRENGQMYNRNNRVISAELNSRLVHPRQGEANATSKHDDKVGFTHEEQKIIDRLIAGEVGLDMVAIVGMPGQGKTNLAERVFRNSCIKRHFHKYAWCWISQTYDIQKILQDILENVSEPVLPETEEDFEKKETQEDLADELRKCLKGRRYLVVLDDMWDAKSWYELKLSFPDDNNGSRILVTSRNRSVALQAKADCCIVELHPLSNEESWNLLQLKVFEENCCPPDLSRIGWEIAEKCQGLPLVIVVVAGLLKKDKNVSSWELTSTRLESLIASAGCLDILDLSYKNLPYYLKPCFLYLGIFEQGKIIDAERLIQLWIAERFGKNDGMKSMEVVANEYLMDLVARNLVLVVERGPRDEIKKCRVHDLLHQLCLTKAEEERFFLVPDVSSRRCEHYRLCVRHKWQAPLDSQPVCVQSLIVSVHGDCLFLGRFKLLRILDMSDVIVGQSRFDEITQLIHLRFLSVACEFSIPSSIVNLFSLEVLCLRYSCPRGILPCAVMKMANLRHIFASRCSISYTQDFDKVKLKSLTNLETFTSLDVGEKSSFKRTAQKIPNILRLDLTLSFCVRLSSYFKKLESLDLCINFESRKISNAISPSTLDFPLTLKELNLRAGSCLSRAMISSIGKLSNLEVLKLGAYFEDEKWDVEDDEFLQLKYFELRSSNLQMWNVSYESFPCLEQLVVDYCPKLGELPDRFGAIATLKRIVVNECRDSVSNSFQQIVDDQMDSGNKGLQFQFTQLSQGRNKRLSLFAKQRRLAPASKRGRKGCFEKKLRSTSSSVVE